MIVSSFLTYPIFLLYGLYFSYNTGWLNLSLENIPTYLNLRLSDILDLFDFDTFETFCPCYFSSSPFLSLTLYLLPPFSIYLSIFILSFSLSLILFLLPNLYFYLYLLTLAVFSDNLFSPSFSHIYLSLFFSF